MSEPEIVTLFDNEWLSLLLLRAPDAGVGGYVFSHETRCWGRIVAVLPFRRTAGGLEFAVKAEVRLAGGDEAEVRSEAWTVGIGCPYGPHDHQRPCVTYWECGCKLDHQQRDRLSYDGEGPCPESPTGRHVLLVGDEVEIGYPTGQCYLRVGEDAQEAIWELRDRLTPGAHRFSVGRGDYGELELTPPDAADTGRAAA